MLYSDTDSIFILINNNNAAELKTEERLKILETVAARINKNIQDYLNNYLLIKQNINPIHNMTEFKTELLINSILFLDVKKSYSFILAAREGKILSVPEVYYTGIQVVKSDTAEITKDLLKYLVENIILSNTPKNKWNNEINKCISQFYKKFLDCVESLNIDYIGFPAKWQKRDQIINGMKIYNHILDEEVFSLGSSGRFVYCNFNDMTLFKGVDIEDISKVNGICFPYVFKQELLKKKLKEFHIEIDIKTQWDKINTLTVQRIIEIIKAHI